ncbi:hypothetical protein HGRIS_009214 [Hohenbuehelia grisea]|uniref:F-box domain-containing protein n=1 Tax=Hohenbuehelia grisea TaxID=104357 RepID=A0ABR3J0G8_9AGAR
MEKDFPDPPAFTRDVYLKQNICDNTLDNAQLETRCPLDNGRHTDSKRTFVRCVPNQLDKLSNELLVGVLLKLDIPSLTRLRGLNHRMMELVNSVRQYTAIVEHCPDIIRAIISIQADAFDCGTLYRTLCTSQCSTCNRFGDHLYLIDCRRVCYFCFTEKAEYFPLTTYEASKFFIPGPKPQSKAQSSRKLLQSANPPSILSLPGRYCSGWTQRGGNLQSRRIRLYDRRAVVQDLSGRGLPQLDKITREPKRYMAIITAPVLLHGGRQVDRGFFCRGCMDESHEETGKHFRNKYTKEGIAEHFATHGRIVKMAPGLDRYTHDTRTILAASQSS